MKTRLKLLAISHLAVAIVSSAASAAELTTILEEIDLTPTGTYDFTSGTIVVNDADLPATITRDTEWDTTAKINAATTDTDFLTLSGAQTISGKIISGGSNTITGLNGASITGGTVAAAYIDAAITRDSEVDAWFADPETQSGFSPAAWRTDLALGDMALEDAATLGNLAPDVSGTRSLGSLGNQWGTVWANTLLGTLQVQTEEIYLNGANETIVWEGTANDFETRLGAIDPNADRTINLPNASGTVALAETVATQFEPLGVAAADITDSTAVGRNVLTAATVEQARTVINAEPARQPATQAEAEAGTEADIRSWSPLRVAQAIEAKKSVPYEDENLFIKSPDGSTWMVQVNNDGNLVTTKQ